MSRGFGDINGFKMPFGGLEDFADGTKGPDGVVIPFSSTYEGASLYSAWREKATFLPLRFKLEFEFVDADLGEVVFGGVCRLSLGSTGGLTKGCLKGKSDSGSWYDSRGGVGGRTGRELRKWEDITTDAPYTLCRRLRGKVVVWFRSNHVNRGEEGDLKEVISEE
jgi:hypothetical protein